MSSKRSVEGENDKKMRFRSLFFIVRLCQTQKMLCNTDNVCWQLVIEYLVDSCGCNEQMLTHYLPLLVRNCVKTYSNALSQLCELRLAQMRDSTEKTEGKHVEKVKRKIDAMRRLGCLSNLWLKYILYRLKALH